MMILLSLLVTTGLITLVRASPYATYRRRDNTVHEQPELLLLYDQRDMEKTDSSPRTLYDVEREYGNELALHDGISEISNEPDVTNLDRTKKLGLGKNSLSIVNPVDVLRQRVLLELARRKAMQDQRQVDENRRILETIGKRSVQLDPDYERSVVSSENGNSRVYMKERLNDGINNKKQETYMQQIPVERTRKWYDVDSTVIRGNGDDETRKLLTTYNHRRM